MQWQQMKLVALGLPIVAISVFLYSPCVDASKIYWTAFDNGGVADVVQRANLDGSGIETIVSVSGDNQIWGVSVDNLGGKVYWTEYRFSDTSTVLRRASINGGLNSNVETLLTIGTSNNGQGRGLEVDPFNGKIYYTTGNDNTIRRANLDGSNDEQLVISSSFTHDVALDLENSPNKMYWVNANSGNVRRSNTDGTGVESLVTGADAVLGIDVDPANGYIYWTQGGSVNQIFRANLDGSGAVSLLSSGNTIMVDVDPEGGFIYWTDQGGGTRGLRRADLNGGNITTLVTNTAMGSSSYFPGGVALALDNTRAGVNDGVNINLGGGIVINFAQITADGMTTKTADPGSEASFLSDPKVGAMLASSIYDISTTATFNGTSGFDVTLYYGSDTINGIPESQFQVFHFTGSGVSQGEILFQDTVNNLITARFFDTTLSPFGVGVNPEPSTLLLFGLPLLGLLRRRK